MVPFRERPGTPLPGLLFVRPPKNLLPTQVGGGITVIARWGAPEARGAGWRKGSDMSGESLLSDYNYFRAFTGNVGAIRERGGRVTYLAPTVERLAALEAMERWCADHGYSPRLWLALAFDRSRWRYAPQFNQLVPACRASMVKAEARYRMARDIPLLQQRMREVAHEEQVASGAAYDPVEDVTATTEALKRRYVELGHDPRDCMADGDTLGFHPRSKVCVACPVRIECAERFRITYGPDAWRRRSGEGVHG